MQQLRSLTHAVTPGRRRRGETYYRTGRVAIIDVEPGAIRAEVAGGETYLVILTWEGEVLWVACTCLDLLSQAEPCKHVWATLVAAAEAGHLARLPPAVEVEVDPEVLALDGFVPDGFDPDDLDPDDLDPDDAVDVPRWARPAGGARPAGAPGRAPTGWASLVAHMDEPTSLADDRRVITYHLDPEETLRRGELTLHVLERRRKLDGAWGKHRPTSIGPDDLAGLADPEERAALAQLAADQVAHWTGRAHGGEVPSQVRIDIPAAGLLLPALCRTGRFWLGVPGEDREPPAPLEWDDAGPWELVLRGRRDEAGDLVVTGELARDDERMELAEPDLLLAGGFVLARGRAARLRDAGAFGWVGMLRQTGRVVVPAGEARTLVAALLRRGPHVRLELPEDLRPTVRGGRPVPWLRVFEPGDGRRRSTRLRAELSFDYQGERLPAGEGATRLVRPEPLTVIERDPETEDDARARLRELGLKPLRFAAAGEYGTTPRRLPRLVGELLADDWIVEAEGRILRRAPAPTLRVTSDVDWFEVRGQVAVGDESVAMPELLAAVRRGDGFVRLGDGSVGVLPEAWLGQVAPLVALGRREADHLRFSRAQAGLLDALLEQQGEADVDAAFARARAELARFDGVEPAAEPRGFRGRLREYQRQGLGWMLFLQRFGFGGCLADDMGLGKTIQVLALLASRRARRRRGTPRRPSLVVVPRSLVFNWQDEARRFAPRLRVLVHTGPDREVDAGRFAEHDVVLTTYGTLRRDVPQLDGVRFDYVVLDEAQAIKNARSQAAKAARLVQADHRLALSGTPVENHIGELWSLFEFLNPGMLGTSSVFRELAGRGREPTGEAARLLSRALAPFVLRRTKAQVAPELPGKTEQTLHCELPPRHRKLYDELLAHYRAELGRRIDRRGIAGSRMAILEALLRLRQTACHPGLVDPARAGESSAKLDLLLPQLDEVLEEGHKVLVFSQFVSLLRLVRDRLDRAGIEYAYLDGRTRDRAARVERFQTDPGCRLFLISLKAGGLGLNLTAAEYVFLLDPWWNPAVEAQAIDRTHRIGQTRHVSAYRIVARDTVEEKILELQQRKRALAEAIIREDGSPLGTLSREDLDLLLS